MGLLGTLKREYAAFRTLKGIAKWTDPVTAQSPVLVCDDIEAVVDRHADKVAFRFEGTLTKYSEFEAQANRIAHWALGQGIKRGDCVALFMENRPDYVAIWFGLSKIGAVTALINSNLTEKGLAHCISVAGATYLITGEEQDQQVAESLGFFADDLAIWTLGGQTTPRISDLRAQLETASPARPDRAIRNGMTGEDMCLYVYTSGTTGLPKAARLPHSRTRGMMRTFIAQCRITAHDRVYITLPLYHGTGGLCGVGIALQTGACIILRRKFSASQFWTEATEQGATAIVYIGELCRYLLNAPSDPKERAHRIRTGFGNGLRPEIWQKFLDRFNVPHLAEFYGSTEGNVSFISVDDKVGAVGRIPSWLNKRFAHVAFVKFDVASEQPVRGQDNFCIRCDDDEVGEVIGRISTDPGQRFEGYSDKSATAKKIMRDVFETGDMWFRTGDLMRKDALGYVYFVDRIGDTFRWKGENVSTNEVGEALSRIDGIATANVYGVPVMGTDGKAGMAAITTNGEIDFDNLYSSLSAMLPSYALPIFIRVQKEAETTGTFKYRKVELVAEGFDPEKIDDPVWMYHPEDKAYVPLTHDRYETLVSGGFRF